MKYLLVIAFVVFIRLTAYAQSNASDYKVSFKVHPASLTCPGEVSISWEVSGLEKISITGVGDDLPLSGSVRQLVKNTETFTLSGTYTSQKEQRSIKRKATVYVDTLQPKLSLMRFPTAIREGSTFLFEWNALQAQKLYMLQPIKKELPMIGTESVTIHQSGKFVFAMTNGCNEEVYVEKNIRILPADTINIPKEAYAEKPIQLQWRLGLTDSVKIDEIPGKTFRASGKYTYKPLDNVTFHFIVYRSYGDIDTLKYWMKVFQKEKEKNILFFSSSRFKVKEGEPVTLAWEVNKADQVFIVDTKDKLPLKGTHTLQPKEPTEYVLCVVNGNRREYATVYVNVIKRNFIKSKVSYSKLAAQSEINMDIIHVDRRNYPDKIKIGVIAYDHHGNFISGLADNTLHKKFFKKVIERIDGLESEVTSFTVREINYLISKPYDMSIVMDYSGSMGELNINSLEKALRKMIELKHTTDRISLTKFDNKIQTLIKFTSSKEQLLKKEYYNDYFSKWTGATALFAGMDEGLRMLDSFATQQKMMIVFTDGYENSSLSYAPYRLVNPVDLVLKARQLGVQIHFVSLGKNVDRKLLQVIANLGDGYYYPIQSHLEIEEVMSEIPRVIKNYYEIEYTPVKKSGGRNIEVVYNNNRGQEKSVVRDQVYTTNDFENIKELNPLGTQFPYVVSEFNGKKPTSAPQAVAFFDFDEDDLLQQYIPALQSYVEQLRNDREALIIIYGHTDLVGSDAYCMKLSERRANAIREFFIQHGIDAARIMVKPCGKKYPIHSLEIYDWQARENRRIEVVLYQ